MNRADLLVYLGAEYSVLLREANIPATDTPGGLQYPADQTFRRLGVDEADLADATHANTAAAYALGDYYTLRRVSRTLATRVDYGAVAVEGDRPRVFRHLESLLATAAGDCAAQGYPVGEDAGGDGWGWMEMHQDIVEPEA